MTPEVYQKKIQKIKLVLFDVDGVLTDGSIYVNEASECFKVFNVKDGLGVELLRANDIKVGVISGKASPSLNNRIEQLKFDVSVTGCKNKLPSLKDICADLNVEYSEVCFVGDDVLDLPIMKVCGFSIAPNDAHEYVKEHCDYILDMNGGFGVARKVADMILLNQMKSYDKVYEPLMNKIQYGDLSGIEQ
ncbi:3-deoxy-manno-octulosonate-8-phosphatase [Lentisphaera araneosa HTCC2155]|uniref:3-deoxy-D-manno-octulosonate 8-phosphate phosphatase KdsC n=1 Tax=Lentisphaera araneosa HTCC2155 TaxID=313628 RepID=A6DQH3_9BACT|nr:HAD-IIIA family hydrolase [Lentisphaera araneosa]EDM26054.1 3-deoxy-manno-octulosonate-8-phosphatase [Lentisphaera araneosa HTCC2155]